MKVENRHLYEKSRLILHCLNQQTCIVFDDVQNLWQCKNEFVIFRAIYSYAKTVQTNQHYFLPQLDTFDWTHNLKNQREVWMVMSAMLFLDHKLS